MTKRAVPKQQSRRAPKRLILLGLLSLLIAAGYVAATYVIAARRDAATLARLPERPALDAATRALGPALDKALDAVHADPSAANVGQLGRLYQANYYYDEATACFERAMELESGNAQWPYLLAYLDNMMGRVRGGEDLLERAIRLDPTYLPALLRRAENKYKSGDHAAAEADYKRCLELHRSNPYARLGLGRIAADAGDWTTAEEQLKMAVGADGQFGTAYRLLATVYGKLGKEEEQQRALAAAAPLGRFEASPDPWVDELERLCYHTEQLLTKGDRAEKIGRMDLAETYFRRVLAIEPDNYVANAELGSLLQRMRKFEEAAPLLEKALSVPPRGEIVRPRDLNLNLGNNYFHQGKPDKAVALYQKTLEQDPSVEEAYHGLAGSYLQLKRPQDAAAACEKVLALYPESHAAQFNWGQALMMMGDIEGAITHYAEAARLNPAYVSADLAVGQFLFQQKDRAGALPYLDRALAAANAAGNAQAATQIQRMLGR